MHTGLNELVDTASVTQDILLGRRNQLENKVLQAGIVRDNLNAMKIPFHHRVSLRYWCVPAMLAIVGCASKQTVDFQQVHRPAANAEVVRVTNNDLERQQKFALWVADFCTTARAAGIDEQTIQSAFKDVHLLPRVIALDRAQPEYTRTVWNYLDSAVSAQRISRGQEKLLQLRAKVAPIAARYGVPIEILYAFWGIESNFGSDVGDIPTIDALSTLGFDGRRAQWARAELMAALKILQNHGIERSRMLGSWAGAMGQTQFMPTVFLAYAIDADGDGLSDLWGSIADVMASTANFIAKSGWQVGEPWGVEVRLPRGFDYARADMDVMLSSSAWASQGVQSMDGSQLPVMADAFIMLPAGARGPAFLVGANFHTILQYNNATSYALAVGLLAQSLAGGPTVQAAWPRDILAMSTSQLLALQTALNERGIDSGTPDGLLGPATQRGIRQYQQSQGLPADGFPTLEILQRLQNQSITTRP